MKFKLSPSSINLMLDCKRCFWLDKHKVWRRPTTPFPSLPSGMDKVLKEHFDNFRKKGRLPPELEINEFTKDCKLFVNNELLRKWRNSRIGISWEDKHGNVLYGAIDDMLIKDDKLIILDFKTRGYPTKENTWNHYKHQLDIYSFLLDKNGYEIENYAFLLFYHPKKIKETGEIIFNSELIKVNVNPENGKRLFDSALKILSNSCPESSCKWCVNITNKN